MKIPSIGEIAVCVVENDRYVFRAMICGHEAGHMLAHVSLNNNYYRFSQ